MVKNWQFFHVFILGKIGQKIVFYDIIERKNAFVHYKKKKKFKKLRNLDFLKGLVHGFGQKLAMFSFFSCRQNRPGKCVSLYSK